jgi:hypothetical protein
MRLRATLTLGLATLCMLLLAPFFTGSVAAGAYPITTCSTLAVSTTNPLPGEAITVTGTNFLPGASVSLVLRPGETALKTVTASASGSFSTQVTMPNSTTNGGNYNIVATTGAVRNSNCPADPIQTLAIQAETDTNGGGAGGGASGNGGSGNGGLSVTGLDIAGLLVLAAALLGTGVALNRRKTRVGSR